MDVSIYDHGIQPKEWRERKLAILQLGYSRNKNGWKFTEVEDKFEVFLNTKGIWENECGKMQPSQVELPLSLKLDLKEAFKPKVEKPKKVVKKPKKK